MINQIKTALRDEEEEERTDGGIRSSWSDSGNLTGPDIPPGEVQSETTDPAVEETANSDLEIDQIFGILKNQRRRYVLRYLSMVGGETTLSDLSEQITAWECEKDIKQITSQERKRVYVGLYQCHLPKMANVSAIQYNKQRGNIQAGEQFDIFTHYLPPGEQATEEAEAGPTVVGFVSNLLG